MKFWSLLLLSLFLANASLLGNGEKESGENEKTAKPEQDEPVKEEQSVTRHSGTFGDEEIDYTATAGTMVISTQEKDPKASMFYVAYTKDAVEDPGTRPIVFCFNGGPGSSGVWLHLGGFGPKRVQMTEDGMMPAPPFRLADNPHSILKVADLVFIDPVSTGYSRPEDEETGTEFHGFEGDLDSMAEFIRLYTTRNERWLSPKFLAGESYGALRAAGLADTLHDKFGFYLNGIILVSGVLSFDTLWGGDLAFTTFLPALSETAAYHKKLDEDLLNDPEARRKAVSEFAKGDYASALLAGARLDEETRDAVATQVSRFTGIDPETVKMHDLRISPSFLRKELLREDGFILGRFDSRVTGRDGNPAGISPEYDPSFAAVFGPFSATLNDYVRRDLQFESDLVYEILSSRVRSWDYGDAFVGQPINVISQLSSVMTENSYLKVMVNCGYQDLATPFSGIEHSLDHLSVDPVLLENIEFTYYEGGHMMYTVEKSNAEWNADVAKFIAENSGENKDPLKQRVRTWKFPEAGPTLWTQTLGREIGVEKVAAASLLPPPEQNGNDQTFPLLLFLGGAWGGTGHEVKQAAAIAGDAPFFTAGIPLFLEDLEPLADDESNKWTRLFIASEEGPNIGKKWEPMLERLLAEPGIAAHARAIGGFSNGANAVASVLNDPASGPRLADMFDTFVFVEGGNRLRPSPWLAGKRFLLVNGEKSTIGSPGEKRDEWLRPLADALEAVGAKVDYKVMPGVGHDFPEMEKEAVRTWLESGWQP